MEEEYEDFDHEYLLEQQIREEGTKATASPPEKKQRMITANPLQPMLDGMKSLWKTISINEEYVPEIGVFKDAVTGALLAPIPATATAAGKVLALKWPCARGKSSAFRAYMTKGFATHPKRRYLLLSANIGYGRNLTSELRAAFPDRYIGFYKDKSCDLSSCAIVVCSLESMWRVASERFDDILLDEVRSLARLVGGETLDLQNVTTLRDLCSLASCVTVCDADLDFKSSASEDTTLVEDFVKLIVPLRKVLKFQTSHPGPPHLRRTATILFASKKNEDRFFEEITLAAGEWHASRDDEHPKRIAIVVGNKHQRKAVCHHLHGLKVPFLHYDGESAGEEKLNLSNPDEAWADVGAIVATTTLSIGVDPKSTTFGRVFLWTSRMGCLPLAQMQAAFRFQRFPGEGFNPEFCALLDCKHPKERAKQVREGKARPIVPRTFRDELKAVVEKKGRRLRLLALEEREGGGLGRGLESMVSVSDLLLRCIAHNNLELHERRSNHFEACKRVFGYHGVQMNLASRGSDDGAAAGTDFASMPDVEMADDQAFGALMDKKGKMAWALENVFERGEDAFRQKCFGYATDEAISAGQLTSRQQKLVDVYFLTLPLDSVPPLLSDEQLYALHPDVPARELCEMLPVKPQQPAVEALLEMEKPGIMDGLRLNAHMRCLSAQEQLRVDDADRGSERKTTHPLLKAGIGARMTLVQRVEELLGVEGLIDGGHLPQPILDIANRGLLGESTFADQSKVARLKELSADIYTATGTKSTNLTFLLKDLASGCGLDFESEKSNEPRENALAAGRPRKQLFTGLWFMRKLPEIVNDWLVWSPRLCSKVRVEDWQLMHTRVDADDMQAGFLGDDDIAHAFAPFTGSGSSVLVEKINGDRLAAELARLRAVPGGSFADASESALLSHQRRKSFCEAMHAAAQPADKDGVRLNIVSYGKSMAIGRRTASYPSMQQCPSSLRPLLVGCYGDGGGEHDIDMVNCHPTLMLTVTTSILGVTSADVPTLAAIVSDREPLLARIAEHYGTSRANAKTCVLRVMNGGKVDQWIKDVNCELNRGTIQCDLHNLAEEMMLVRRAFFAMPELKDAVVALRLQIKTDREAAARAAADRVAVAPPSRRQEARRQAEKARAKADYHAVDRSVFSYLLGEVEDRVLGEIEKYMTSSGWTVSARIFDGLHVQHRPGLTQHEARLLKAMEGAEGAVRKNLGYSIKLLEKPLFEATTAGDASSDIDEEESDAEV